MPRSKPPRTRRRRPRRVPDVLHGMAETLTRMIAVVDEAARRIERVAHKVPPAEMAQARALLERTRREYEAIRAETFAPLDLPHLTRALREAAER